MIFPCTQQIYSLLPNHHLVEEALVSVRWAMILVSGRGEGGLWGRRWLWLWAGLWVSGESALETLPSLNFGLLSLLGLAGRGRGREGGETGAGQGGEGRGDRGWGGETGAGQGGKRREGAGQGGTGMEGRGGVH